MSRRPQPVLAAAQVSAIATWASALLVGWLAHRGWLLPDAVTEQLAGLIEVGIVAAVGALGSLLAGLVGRSKVTPLADPRAADGGQLVPAPAEPAPKPVPRPRAAPAPPPGPVPPPAVPATTEITRITVGGPPVDVAALRREYGLD